MLRLRSSFLSKLEFILDCCIHHCTFAHILGGQLVVIKFHHYPKHIQDCCHCIDKFIIGGSKEDHSNDRSTSILCRFHVNHGPTQPNGHQTTTTAAAATPSSHRKIHHCNVIIFKKQKDLPANLQHIHEHPHQWINTIIY